MVMVAIPIRSFAAGNRRLAVALELRTRRRLAEGLAERAVDAAIASGADEVAIVPGSQEVRDWAATRRLLVVDDPGDGLDRAAAAAARAAIDTDVAWLVLHADLPLITAEALAPVVAAAAKGPVIAPSHNGGTSALGGVGERSFRYGPVSFHAHIAQTPSLRVFVDYRLAVDVDTPRDLEIAARLPGGDWLKPFLGSFQ